MTYEEKEKEVQWLIEQANNAFSVYLALRIKANEMLDEMSEDDEPIDECEYDSQRDMDYDIALSKLENDEYWSNVLDDELRRHR